MESSTAEEPQPQRSIIRLWLAVVLIGVLAIAAFALAIRDRSEGSVRNGQSGSVAAAPPDKLSSSSPPGEAAPTTTQGCPTTQPFPQNLANCDLHDASLVGGFPSGEDLEGANLSGSNLLLDSLQSANLTNANLTGANLTYADLTNANLTNANLTNAGMSEAVLSGVNLTGANLTGADLAGINLAGADTHGVIYIDNPVGITWSNTICPDSSNSNNDGGTCNGHTNS